MKAPLTQLLLMSSFCVFKLAYIPLAGKEFINIIVDDFLNIIVPLPISFPSARNRMGQRGGSNHKILLAIRHAAMIFAPSDLARISREIRAGDMMMLANFGATEAGEIRLGLVRASAFV